MNKIIFTLLLLFLHFKVSADGITFIYIDLSDSPNKERVQQLTEKIVKSNQTYEFIIFISNDVEPILIDEVDKIQEVISSINQVPSKPYINKDIELINELMYKRNILKNNKVHFNFLLTPTNSANRFINKLLLTNRLVDREGLDSDVKVSIYPFGDKETEEYKSNCNIFKEKKYEINY
tara:strand:- start:316 stop:849 length:534 start_codon:yes stop_codon:yes gene_type:complete